MSIRFQPLQKEKERGKGVPSQDVLIWCRCSIDLVTMTGRRGSGPPMFWGGGGGFLMMKTKMACLEEQIGNFLQVIDGGGHLRPRTSSHLFKPQGHMRQGEGCWVGVNLLAQA